MKNYLVSTLVLLLIGFFNSMAKENVPNPNDSNNYRIICIGGAINMASGVEKEIPSILDTLGLEFLWRLKNDPTRRLKRLIETFFIYIFQEVKGKFKNFYIEEL